jgi:hypothetical protein
LKARSAFSCALDQSPTSRWKSASKVRERASLGSSPTSSVKTCSPGSIAAASRAIGALARELDLGLVVLRRLLSQRCDRARRRRTDREPCDGQAQECAPQCAGSRSSSLHAGRSFVAEVRVEVAPARRLLYLQAP